MVKEKTTLLGSCDDCGRRVNGLRERAVPASLPLSYFKLARKCRSPCEGLALHAAAAAAAARLRSDSDEFPRAPTVSAPYYVVDRWQERVSTLQYMFWCLSSVDGDIDSIQ